MTVREYIGARYVPLMMGEWDNTKTYEPLSVVLYHGNSYTSRQYVPTGIDIANETYWAETGNYNAQVEAYRAEVQNISAIIPASDFDSEHTVKDYIDNAYVAGVDVVESVSDLATHLEEPVIVMDYDSDYQQKTPQLFIPSETQNPIFDVECENGFLTVPIRQDSCVPNGYDYSPYLTALTWFGKGAIYGRNGTIWDQVVNTQQLQFVCSDWVYTLLRGVTYDSSAFVNGNLNNASGMRHATFPANTIGYDKDDHRQNYVSYELAYWFAVNGRLFTHNRDNYLNIMPGDILFTSNLDSEDEDYGSKWMNINHCQMVLAAYPDCGYAIVTECTQTQSNFYYNILRNTLDRTAYHEPTVSLVKLDTSRIIAIGRPAWPNIQPLMTRWENDYTHYSGTYTSSDEHDVKLAQVDLVDNVDAFTPVICRIKGVIKTTDPDSTEHSLDMQAQYQTTDDEWHVMSRTRWNLSPLTKVYSGNFWEFPCIIAQEAQAFRVIVKWTGESGHTWSYSYNMDDVQFIKLD